jgi:sugar lactone lactonase YvrE
MRTLDTCSLAGGLIVAAVVAACSSSPSAPRGTSGPLYVANQTGRSITVYAPGATGNATPLRTIAGSSTGLSQPNSIARDSAGRLYVINYGTSVSSPETLTVYADSATGNAAPVRTIPGIDAGRHNIWGLAVDAAGRLYVATSRVGGDTIGDTIKVFAANASANTTPLYTIGGSNTGLNVPEGIALDPAGQLYVANYRSSTVTIYAPGASGNIAPIATIAGSSTGLNSPAFIALDRFGQLYVLNIVIMSNHAYYRITVYSANATGDATPIATLAGGDLDIGVPSGMAVDGAGRLYVAKYGTSTIAIYAPGASGSVAPIDSIAGPGTGLSWPASITF